MHREGRELVPTAKAFQLMTLLRGLDVEDLTKPELTGNWEYQLARDGARPAEPRGLHGRDRGDDRAHRQEGQGVRPRHHPRRLRDARDAVPELRRRGEGELPPLRLHRQGHGRRGLRLLVHQDPGRPRLRDRPRPRPSCATRRSARWRASAPRPAGRSRPSCAWRTTTRSRTGSSSSTSATTRKDEADGEPVDFSGQKRARRLPEVQGPCLRARQQLRLRARGAAPTLTCDFKSGKIILQQPVRARADDASCWPAARPICSRTSSRTSTRRKFKAFLRWDKKEGKVGFEFEPRPAKPAAGAKVARKKAG